MSERKRVFHKRKRKHQSVSDDQTASFLTKSREFDPDKTGDKGIWCRECRKRITWRDLELEHELRRGSLYRVWWCPRCGNMVQADDLHDMMMACELDAKPGIREISNR